MKRMRRTSLGWPTKKKKIISKVSPKKQSVKKQEAVKINEKSLNELITRFFALPRVLYVIKEASEIVNYRKEVKPDIIIEYWEFQQVVERVLVRAVVSSINGGPKFFLSCVWLGTKDEQGIQANQKDF